MPPNEENAITTSNLCTRCSNLKLVAAGFYLSEQEAKQKANPDNIYDPETIDTRPWGDIAASTECDLCQMIKGAVEASRFDWQAAEVPNFCDINTKRLHGHDSVKFDVRYLEIVAHYDWTSSHGIALLPADSEEYPGCFPGRVINPQGIEIPRIKAWMDQCQNAHGDACRHIETLQFKEIHQHILVFDVEDHCLVTLPPAARYLALSYVWGSVEQPTTRKSNFESFKARYGLDSVYSQLPKAIVDAVDFVKALGERYLWVDTLCIVQDDVGLKMTLINSMHVVYENAYLTLFAATGADSNAGLPGVQPNSRGVSQHVTTVSDGLTLISPISYGDIKRSKWATRAWTYQEYFFAKRRLLFLSGQMVYQCNTIRWREDIAQEHLEKGLVHFQVDGAGNRMSWEPPAKRFPNAESGRWSRHSFNTYLETYLDRNLTFDNDILNAFAGIIQEAESKKLKCYWGLMEKNIGIDMLWLPCKWLIRRPGFPSWSWAGWKGPIISGRVDQSSETVWQHRKSWIDWYGFRKGSGKFHLLSSGYVPQQEKAIIQEEEQNRAREERLGEIQKKRKREDSNDNDDEIEAPIGVNRGSLTSLLWRLCQSNSDQAPSERDSPYPLYCTPTIDEQTLLFRTLTAYVAISTLNPSGKPSLLPRDDQLLLPSAPTLHMYALDGTHIGSAWSHTREFFDQIAAHDREATTQGDVTARLQIEIALVAGPLQGDWRTRIEKPSTWQYMLELSAAGLHLGMLHARYERKFLYEKAIAQVYISMVLEQQKVENNTEGVGKRLTVAFWEELQLRVEAMNLVATFPGHCDETMEAQIDSLTTSGSGMRSKKGQSFFKVMLIGNLGDGETNGSGGIKERVGMGEVRDDAMGLIRGLAVRDVMLK
jgi:hypothetical protein